MLGAFAFSVTYGVGVADPAEEAPPPNPFEADIRAFEAQDAESMPPERQILFVGSSSIRMWNTDKWFPDRGIINRGFGGSTMSDAVYFFDRIVAPYRPRAIFLYEGDNDIAGGRPAEQVRDGFVRFAALVEEELPGTPLYYLPIKPSAARWDVVDEMRRANCLINVVIRDHEWMHYVDTNEILLGPGGTPRPELYLEDGLHLSEAGYALWTDIVEPLLPE